MAALRLRTMTMSPSKHADSDSERPVVSRKAWSKPRVVTSQAAARTDKVAYPVETTPGGTSFGLS